MKYRLKKALAASALLWACALPWAQAAQAQGLGELIQKKVLKNGLTVLVLEDHSVPLATVEIAVKHGAYTEPPEFNGLSHLYEHMFFKGNAAIPNQEAYLKRMRELGIVFNGTTSSERVNYYFTMPSKNITEGIVFMRDAIVTPKFDEEEFKREIQVVIGEVDRNESNPFFWFLRAQEELLWFKHPTRKDVLGDRDTITTSTIKKMRTIQERYYVPNNSVLVIAGDVDPSRAFADAEREFASWKPSKKDPHIAHPVPVHPALPATSSFVLHKQVQVPYVQVAWHGPSVRSDEKATYAADVLSFILGQPASAFQKALVDSGVTLGASLGYYTQAHTGPISASAQMRPDKLEEAVEALLTEVYKMTDPTYFTDEQLASAKKILAVQSTYEREKTSSLVQTVSFWWSVAGLDYYVNYLDNLEKVTREDIARYVEAYLIDKPFVAGLLIDEQVGADIGMDAAAFDALVKKVEAKVKAKHKAKRAATRTSSPDH
ncbi:MAG: pitrilysin family protein [Myxococcota bacterium]